MPLNVDINGNASGFQQAINTAKLEANKFAQDTAGTITGSLTNSLRGLSGAIAGVFTVEGIKEFIGGLMETTRSIHETAQEFDMSTDSVQRWEKALDKAGVSSTIFYRSLEALRQKRQEARLDPSKAEEFEKFGLRGEALGRDVSDEDLLRRILESKTPRASVNDLLPRAARLRGALPYLNNQPLFSEDDIDKLHEVDVKAKGAWNVLKRAFSEIFVEMIEAPGKIAHGDIFLPSKAQRAGEEAEKVHQQEERQRIAEEQKTADDAADKAETDRKNRRKIVLEGDTFEKQQQAAELALRSAERGNMTIGQRRASLREELRRQTERVLRERREVEDGRGGLSASDWNLLTPDEQRRKLQEKHLELLGDESKKQGLQGELRERPLEIHPDSLAKMGLYTSAALNGSGSVSNIPKLQLEVLHRIDSKLGKAGLHP